MVRLWIEPSDDEQDHGRAVICSRRARRRRRRRALLAHASDESVVPALIAALVVPTLIATAEAADLAADLPARKRRAMDVRVGNAVADRPQHRREITGRDPLARECQD